MIHDVVCHYITFQNFVESSGEDTVGEKEGIKTKLKLSFLFGEFGKCIRDVFNSCPLSCFVLDRTFFF